MVPGFNHNVQYKKRVYHIQTEDSGVANPHIITLLYNEGTILAKKMTSYAEIAKAENLAALVRELMEEQHKAMLRDLVRGVFDEQLEKFISGGKPAPQSSQTSVSSAAVGALSQKADARSAEQGAASSGSSVSSAPVAPPPPVAAKPVAASVAPPQNDLAALFEGGDQSEKSLDEIILSYLADEK